MLAGSPAGDPLPDPHGDPDHGVLLDATIPPTRGECIQCHPSHGDAIGGTAEEILLFTENTNALAFWSQGAAACHADRPVNYPLDESERLPEGNPDAGYYEANVGGDRRVGVEFRGRWPGESVYTDPRIVGDGRFASPHAFDPDMPRTDAAGEGLCFNCHDPHPTENPLDLLVKPYRGIGGSSSVGAPVEYELCFSCHGLGGPAGMDPENLRIRDYYDPVLNSETAGHRIRRDPDIALSWPASVRVGDMLACSDCHNAHGSRGNDGVSPNGFLISDQRTGWSGLTDTIGDAAQSRRFCLGCHIPSDGIAGTETVRGIVMNTLPATEPEHDSFAAQSCHDCHGRDYSSPTAFNVHHPDDANPRAQFLDAPRLFGD
jgi:hypothetical protein